MRIFLAATTSGMNEDNRKQAFKESKPLYCLETFFNGERTCEKVLKDVGVENFLLDSGAFSYMSGAKCTKEMLLSYLDKYIAFINKHNIKYFFELDVDTIFGIEFVEMMRKKLENETNKQCIPVWHKGRGIEYWKKMVANYKYIAIGGLVFHVKKQEWPLIKKMVDYAYSKGVKVHGLGFTKTKILDDYKFYSVDSAIGQFLDNAVFAFIGFLGVLPLPAIISMVIGGTIFEVLYEIIFYPITKLSINKLKKYINN